MCVCIFVCARGRMRASAFCERANCNMLSYLFLYIYVSVNMTILTQSTEWIFYDF